MESRSASVGHANTISFQRSFDLPHPEPLHKLRKRFHAGDHHSLPYDEKKNLIICGHRLVIYALLFAPSEAKMHKSKQQHFLLKHCAWPLARTLHSVCMSCV